MRLSPKCIFSDDSSPSTSTENGNSKSKLICICVFYNKFMGGVDLLDSLIDLYHKKIGQRNGIIALKTSKTSFITVQA